MVSVCLFLLLLDSRTHSLKLHFEDPTVMICTMDTPVLLEVGMRILPSKSQLNTWDALIKRFFVEGLRHIGYCWLKWSVTWTVDLGDSMAPLLKDRNYVLPQLGTRLSSSDFAVIAGHYPTIDCTKKMPTLPCVRRGYNDSTYDLTNRNNRCVQEMMTKITLTTHRDVMRNYLGLSEDKVIQQDTRAAFVDMTLFQPRERTTSHVN